MKTETEIFEKRQECFFTAWAKRQDENEECAGDYYSGAWHALLWVMGETDDI